MTKNTIKIILAAVGLVVATALAYPIAASLNRAHTQNTINNARKARIEAIYASLHLDSKYKLVGSKVFGEKRVYEWDKSRTYSSAKLYLREANVDATVAEVRKAVEKAGFVFAGEPYPGSSFTELHFKSAKGEYIRLNVASKPRDDALREQIGKSTLDFTNVPDANQGPSNVTIKVNLDDNNE